MGTLKKTMAAAAAILAINAAAASAQTVKKIRIGYPSLSFRQSNVWVAKEYGLFNKYGLEVEPIFLRGGQMATQALVAGDPPIVNIGTVVQASLRGYNLVLVAAVENNYDQIVFARPNITPYSATKGGIVMLTQGMCADLGPHGIQANALAPGYFATELTQALVDDVEFSAWVAKRTPAGRWGRVHELAGALVFLASPASDFVNGQVIYVDGGMTAVV